MLLPRPATLAVLASGNGTNFEALALAAREGGIGGSIAVLLSDSPEAPALARAQRLGIPGIAMPAGRFRTKLDNEERWVEVLREHRADVVLLAGFMRRLHGTLLDAFPDRILNIHPSLLPAFQGLDAIGQALAAGVRETGCTVHVVNAALDGGPVVAQRAVAVRADDTLATLEARVHTAEHALYPQAVRRFLEEPWKIEGGRVVFGAAAETRRG